MVDWNVQVFTKDGQVKNVRVYDYNYPSDAERAALSQTGGERVIWSAPLNDSESYDTSESESYDYTPSSITYDFDYSTKGGLIVGYVCATAIPTIILSFINPIPAILFNIAFARWWFTD